eukprot:IDg3561t1
MVINEQNREIPQFQGIEAAIAAMYYKMDQRPTLSGSDAIAFIFEEIHDSSGDATSGTNPFDIRVMGIYAISVPDMARVCNLICFITAGS